MGFQVFPYIHSPPRPAVVQDCLLRVGAGIIAGPCRNPFLVVGLAARLSRARARGAPTARISRAGVQRRETLETRVACSIAC